MFVAYILKLDQREKFHVYILNFVFFKLSVKCVVRKKNMFYWVVEKFRVFFSNIRFTILSILLCNHNVVLQNIVLRYMFAIVVLIMFLTVNQHIFIESVTFTHHTVLQCCHSLDGYMYIQQVGTENYSALSSSEPVDFTVDCIFFTKGCESPGTVTIFDMKIECRFTMCHFIIAGGGWVGYMIVILSHMISDLKFNW